MTPYEALKAVVEAELAKARSALTEPPVLKEIPRMAIFLDEEGKQHRLIMPDAHKKAIASLIKYFTGHFAAVTVLMVGEAYRSVQMIPTDGSGLIPPRDDPNREDVLLVYALDKALGRILIGEQPIVRDGGDAPPRFPEKPRFIDLPDSHNLGALPSVADLWGEEYSSHSKRLN